MLTPDQAEDLGKRAESMKCIDPSAADGLFTFVFKGEPEAEAPRFERHLEKCEHCQIALQLYRYKRQVAGLFSKVVKGS